MLTFIAGMVACSTGLWAQPETSEQGFSAIHASDAYPAGAYEVDYNLSDEEGYRHGLWIRVYDDGALYYRGLFEHGMPTGEWWFFRPDGSALSRMDQHPDSSRTRAFMFDTKGNVVATGDYLIPQLRLKAKVLEDRPEPPVKDGKWSFYSGKGRLASVVHYRAGTKHGLEETYMTNGRVLSTGNHVEGQKDGPWKRFTDTGNLEELLTYKNGVLHGPAQAANRRAPMSNGAYYEGKQDGTWTYYMDDGTLQEINVFEEGVLTETSASMVLSRTGTIQTARQGGALQRQAQGRSAGMATKAATSLKNRLIPKWVEPWRRQVMKGLQISREGEYVQASSMALSTITTPGRLVRTEHYDMGSLVKTTCAEALIEVVFVPHLAISHAKADYSRGLLPGT